MQCKHAREKMGAYLYGDLEASEMNELRMHTLECDACREDLETRGAVVATLSNRVIPLDNDEKQEIAWQVKGALRAKNAAPHLRLLRPAAAFMLIGMLLLGLAIGKVIDIYTPESIKQAQDGDSPKAVVKVTPAEPRQPAPAGSETAAEDEKTGSGYTISPRIIEHIGKNLRRSSGYTAARDRKIDKRKSRPLDKQPPAPVVTPEESESEMENKVTDVEPSKLPPPTGLNDAQTNTPADTQ